MYEVLRTVAEVNDGEKRGVQRKEMAGIARATGMDPRGLAGYYTPASRLLRKKGDARWITDVGRKRLRSLADRLGREAA